MSVLICGGAGYIGTHTCVELIASGYDIVVADNLSDSSETTIRRVGAITGWKARYGIVEMCASSWKWQCANPNGYGGI